MKKNIYISRRNFIRLCGGALLFLGTGCGSLSSETDPVVKTASHALRGITGDIDAKYIRQIITADASDSRRIMWQSDEAEKDAEIECRSIGSDSSVSLKTTSEAFTDDGITCYLHSALLTDLIPGQDYEYRIVSASSGTPWHALHAAGNGAFKALIFPDSQSNNYDGWQELAQNAAKRNPDTQFFVNMGDLVDNGEDHTQWNAWMGALDGIMDRIPLAPVMGNHETYTLDWKVRLPQAYLHAFDVPDNGSDDFARYYYSFDYGDAHFMVLNTQFDETNDFKPGLLDEELNWFKADAKKSTKKWKIVLMHKDVLTYANHRSPDRKAGIGDIGRDFMPAFDALGIDLVLTAHLHTYRNRGQLYDFRPASQGPFYIITGVAGDVRYPGLWIDHPFDKKIAPQPETDNYLTLEVSDAHLLIRCFLPDGSEIDTVEIKK